jgi:GNAT superfamily N-acetyltransferase
MLSYHKEPFSHPVTSAAAMVRPDGSVEQGETATSGGSRGLGFGTTLYRRMLRFHGKMLSDTSVSAPATRVWEKILADPGVSGAKGQPATDEPHRATTSEPWTETPIASARLNGLSFNELDEALDNPKKRFIEDKDFSGRPYLKLHSVFGDMDHAPSAKEALDTYGPYRESFLRKMALKDIPVGQKIGANSFDYNHVLTPDHRSQGLSLRVSDVPDETGDPMPTARLYDAEGAQVGAVTGRVDRRTLNITNTFLHRNFRKQRLGVAMYEALLSHAKNRLQLRSVAGEEHSTAASRTHMQLAEKHGLSYEPEYKSTASVGQDYDDRAGPYSYLLKAEGDALAKAEKRASKPPTEHPFWQPLRSPGDAKTKGDFWSNANNLAENTLLRLKRMDFTLPPPEIHPSFVPAPEHFEATYTIHDPQGIRNSHNAALAATKGDLKAQQQVAQGTAKKWATAMNDPEANAAFRRLRSGLQHITGTITDSSSSPFAHIMQEAPENLGGAMGLYTTDGVVRIHRDHAAHAMESMAVPRGQKPLVESSDHHEAWATVFHELFHSVSHYHHVYESAASRLRPGATLEEATTEIPARFYARDTAFHHWHPSPDAKAHADARNLFHIDQNGEVGLRSPVCYSGSVQQFGRLVEFAHRREINGDVNRLNNAIVNHSLLAKRTPGQNRLRNIIHLMMDRHDMPIETNHEEVEALRSDTKDLEKQLREAEKKTKTATMLKDKVEAKKALQDLQERYQDKRRDLYMEEGRRDSLELPFKNAREVLEERLRHWLQSDGTSKDLDAYVKEAQNQYRRSKATLAAYE